MPVEIQTDDLLNTLHVGQRVRTRPCVYKDHINTPRFSDRVLLALFIVFSSLSFVAFHEIL